MSGKLPVKRRVFSFLVHFALFFFLLFFLLPFLWMIITSLQPRQNVMSVPMRFGMDNWYINYTAVLNNPRFVAAFTNTVVISVCTTVLTLMISTCAAYAFSRYSFKGKSFVLFSSYSIQMGPAISFLLPIFLFIRTLGLFDTRTGVVLVGTTFLVPVAMWIMIGFFSAIPREMEEAGFIDGCGRLGVFFRIVLPLARPGLISAGIVSFVMIWCDLLIPLILTLIRSVPLTVFTTSFRGMYQTDYGASAAVSVIASLPTVILLLVFRKYLLKGLIEGAIKG